LKLVGLDCFDYELRYVHGEYVMSGGRAAASQTGTLIRLRTDEGLDGWGEITPLGSTYLPTFAEGARTALRFLAPHLLGLDPTNVSGFRRSMDAALMGHQYAKSAVDIACWDLRGKAAGLPIAALLGGVLQKDFPLYEAVPLGSPESMASFAGRRIAAGIKRFQLKVGNNPHEDAARTRAVVEAVTDDTIVIADSNGGWSLLDARIAMNSMAGLPVFIEQPCRTTEDSALASRDSKLPLVLDESIITLSDVYEAKRSAGVSSINIKISRVGGITGAALMRDVMQELDLMVSVEDMWGGDLITAAVSHLAASTRPESLLMTSFMNDWTDGHVAGYRPRSVNGRGSAPTGPGLGIEIDTSLLGEPLFSVEAEQESRHRIAVGWVSADVTLRGGFWAGRPGGLGWGEVLWRCPGQHDDPGGHRREGHHGDGELGRAVGEVLAEQPDAQDDAGERVDDDHQRLGHAQRPDVQRALLEQPAGDRGDDERIHRPGRQHAADTGDRQCLGRGLEKRRLQGRRQRLRRRQGGRPPRRRAPQARHRQNRDGPAEHQPS